METSVSVSLLGPPFEDRAPSTIMVNPDYTSAAFATTMPHVRNPNALLLQSACEVHMLQSAKTR